MSVKIGIADDQQLFLKSLAQLIDRFKNFVTVMEASNGEVLLKKLQLATEYPDILIMDVNMPVMDGVAASKVVSEKYPNLKIVALSMKDDDTTIIEMLKAGACAYLLKDIHPMELEKALVEINEKGYYNADELNIRYRRLLKKEQKADKVLLSEQELRFLRYACSELTYKQIAAEMNKAVRTVDGYRESVFQKFNVQSRVGMAMEAIRRQLVEI